MGKPRSFTYTNKQATLANIDIETLAKKYGTPLYILDKETVEFNCDEYLNPLKEHVPNFKVLYASKANANLGLFQFMKQKGMCIDVSSGGELYTALKADVDGEKIYFHGNNKTPDELDLAIKNNVNIVVDNESEIQKITELLNQSSKKDQTKVNLMIRMKPEIDAHTHDYIKTGNLDSKFGIERAKCVDICKKIKSHPQFDFLGIHSHIGSQIFDIDPYQELVELMVHMVKILNQEDIEVKELNIGGGLGIHYTDEDTVVCIAEVIKNIAIELKNAFNKAGLDIPTLLLEPGRSIVGNAGITVYKVGTVKEIEGLKTYVFIDGGMADNPRPMMYQAKHSVANTKETDIKKRVSIAGKYCESSDILAHDIYCDQFAENDYLIVFGTGAYNYSMASNYNRNCRPAMIWVENGVEKILVQRETYEDLIRLDREING